MPLPDMSVLAEGSLPTGERWALRGGGDSTNFYTFLQTTYPDGNRDEGGMGGKPLYQGSVMNTYAGGSDGGLRRVLVRADPGVALVRVNVEDEEPLDLSPVAARPDLGLAFFVALLPPTAVLASVTAIGESGQVLQQQDLTRHEAGWRRFRREHGQPGD